MAVVRVARDRWGHALDPATMGVAAWIAVGAAAGCIAGRIRPIRPPGATWAATAAGMAGGFVGGGTAALAGAADPAAVAPQSVLAAILGAALLVLVIGRAARAQRRAERPAPPAPARPSVPSADAGTARLIVLCGRPYQLTAVEAADWLRRDVQRLLEADAVTHAELTQVQAGSAHHPAGCHWMVELRLEDGIDAHGLADEPPCADWLSELRQLGMQPVVLLADGGTVHRAPRR